MELMGDQFPVGDLFAPALSLDPVRVDRQPGPVFAVPAVNEGHFQKWHVLKAGYPKGTFRTCTSCWPAGLDRADAV